MPPTDATTSRRRHAHTPRSTHQRARKHRLTRSILIGAMLVGLIASALVSGKGTHDSDAPDDGGPYRVHETGGGAGGPPPDSLRFRGHVYVRGDLANEHLVVPGTTEFWLYLAGTVLCVSMAAMAAGLTVGLVSIDPFDLAVIQMTEESDCSTPEEVADLREEKVYADRLMPLVQQHHLLLVTLLIMNSFANELLPLLLDTLVPSWLAVILSVTFVLIFGEILPSAFFTGPQQLRLASSLVPLVYCFMCALFVLAWPIAWVLDHALGVEDDNRLRRSELKSLIRLQANHPTGSPGESPTHAQLLSGEIMSVEHQHQKGVLSLDEMNILHGVLEMKDRTVHDAMVSLDEVFMLPLSTVLDLNQLAAIIHQGHSRIPIYDTDRANIRGVLLVKRLIVVNPEDRRPLRTIATRWPLLCSPNMPLLDCLNLFQTGRSHMAIVTSDPARMMGALRAEQPIPDGVQVLGVITIEDIIETLIKEEISDETDLGVRSDLLHSEVVRRRIQKLKALAAKESGLVVPSKSSVRHLRTASVASRLAFASSSVTTTARTSPLISQVTRSPTMTAHSETSSLSFSRANTVTYQSVDDVKLDVDVIVTGSASSSTSATPRSTLPRDASFTRLGRTPLIGRSPSVASLSTYALPPLPQQVPSPVVAPTPTRASSILTPRINFASGAMARKDLDSRTVAMLHQAVPTPSASASATATPHSHGRQTDPAADDESTMLLPPPCVGGDDTRSSM